MLKLIFEMDGNSVCCHDENFVNLQESVAGFGDTIEEALSNYLKENDENAIINLLVEGS